MAHHLPLRSHSQVLCAKKNWLCQTTSLIHTWPINYISRIKTWPLNHYTTPSYYRFLASPLEYQKKLMDNSTLTASVIRSTWFYTTFSGHQTMNRIDLAECVCLSASGVTRLLAPLEKIGLVNKEINPRDARQSLVKLSTAGERIYKESNTSFGHCAQSFLTQLNEKQLEKFIELCAKIN